MPMPPERRPGAAWRRVIAALNARYATIRPPMCWNMR
jgi:hypothetical protein